MKKYEKKFGNWLGTAKLWLANTTLQVVFIQPLQKLGPKPGDICDVYHDTTPDGRWVVTYVQTIPEPVTIEQSAKEKANA